MKIFDISQEVFSCQVYPGDPAPEKKILNFMEKGDLYNLTAFSMCAHNGTHIDAPYHFLKGGKTVDAISLEAFVGKACQSAGHIFVDKSGPKKIQETIQHAEKVLQGGTSLVVFPEGARSFTGHLGYLKKGAFQLSDELQLPVVPLTIDGSFDILPRTG